MTALRVARLEDLVVLSDSGTWGADGDQESGFPVLRSTNIVEHELDLRDLAWRRISAGHIEPKRLEAGDILVTTSSGSPDHIGKCCVFEPPADGRSYYFSNFTMRLRVDPRQAESRWLYHWLKSPRGRAALSAQNTTTTGLRNINRASYLAQQLSVPPVTEQRRIAEVLDKADSLRQSCQTSLGLLDDLLHSAFLEMFGDPARNEKEWPVVRLGDCLVVAPSIGTIEPATVDGQLRLVRVGQLGEYDVALDRCARVTIRSIEIPRMEAREDDLLIARAIGSEEHLGKASVVQDTSEPLLFDSHVMRLRVDQKALRPSFLWQWLRTRGGRTIFLRRGGRTAVQFNINGSQVSGLPLPLPPLQEQDRFLGIANEDRALRTTKAEALRHTHALYASLTQQAFSGGP